MARIPRADNFQVVPGIRQGRAQAVLSPEQASLPGRRMMAQGEQMGRLGGALADYAQQQQEKLNTAQAQDALRQAERQALGLRLQMEKIEGAQAAQGIDGMPIGLYFDTELGRGIEEIARNIPSQPARERFMMEAAGLRNRFAERAMLYEAQQADVYLQQNLDAEIGHQNDLLISESNDPRALVERIPKVREAYAAKFREAGFAGDALDQEVRKEMAKSHNIVIEQYLNQDNFEAAKTYFELNRDDYMAADAAAMQTALDTQGRELRVIGTADQLWTRAGGDYGAAIASARKISDPEERTKVEARLATMKAQDDAAKSAKDEADLETGMSYVVQGASIPASWYAQASPLVIDRIQSEQQERADRARAQASMTAEEKAAIKAQSASAYGKLKAQIADPELSALGFEGLMADPRLDNLYKSMTDEDKDKFRLDLANSRQNVEPDEVTKQFRNIMALSGAMLPESLTMKQYGSTFLGAGEGEPGVGRISNTRVKSNAALRLEGILVEMITQELQRTNGAPIEVDRARQLFGMALAEAGGEKKGAPRYAPSQEIIEGSAALDMRREILDFRNQNPKDWSQASTLIRALRPEADEKEIYMKARELLEYRQRREAARRAASIRSGAVSAPAIALVPPNPASEMPE